MSTASKRKAQPDNRSYVTVTARVNAATKQSAQSILEEKGLSISIAVQRTLENVARTGDVPFLEQQTTQLSQKEISKRLKAVQAFELPEPINLSDAEIREMRLREKYGLDLDA